MIVRLYETDNGRADVTLKLLWNIEEAWECDMLEEKEKTLAAEGQCVKFEMKPFEIKTLRLRLHS